MHMSEEMKAALIQRVQATSDVADRKWEKAKQHKKEIEDRQYQMKMNEKEAKHQEGLLKAKRELEKKQQDNKLKEKMYQQRVKEQEIRRKAAEVEEEERALQSKKEEEEMKALQNNLEWERQKEAAERALAEKEKNLLAERRKGFEGKAKIRENTNALWEIVKKPQNDVSQGDIDTVRDLLGRSDAADVNMIIGGEGGTCFTKAVCRGHFEIVRLMTGKLPNTRSRDGNGSPPLAIAIQYNIDPLSGRLVNLLSSCDCDPADQDKDGNTALHLACMNGRFDTISVLSLNPKAKPCKTVRNGENKKPDEVCLNNNTKAQYHNYFEA